MTEQKHELERKVLRFKVDDVTEAGEFTGYASVTGNVDSGGDIIERGAFRRTLANWRKDKRPIPVLYQHNVDRPIGKTLEAKEDERGLWVKGKLLLDLPAAQEAHVLMKESVMTGLSIGYRSVKDWYDRDEEVRHLKEVKLYEWSPVVWPMNTEARVTAVKEGDKRDDAEDDTEDIDARILELSRRSDALHVELEALLAALPEPADEPTPDPPTQHSGDDDTGKDSDPGDHSLLAEARAAGEWLRTLREGIDQMTLGNTD